MFRALDPGDFASTAQPGPDAPGLERPGPVFTIDEPVSVVSPVVFASPHSGRLYPQAFLDACRAPLIDLRRIEDAYVDRLLSDVHLTGSPVICGLIGRACIDLNRAETEMDPAMFTDPPVAWRQVRSPRIAAGLGCIPRIASNGSAIYARRLTAAEAGQRVDQIYRPYHRALDALLRRAHAMFGQAWLIDCHSMPADTDGTVCSPDIVIGDRYGGSCQSGLTDLIERLFTERGYSTARNAPYAGGFATVTHGQPHLGRHAIQIEIRRRLYLDEAAVEPNEGFLALRRHMTEIADEICAYGRRVTGRVCALTQGPERKSAAPEAGAAKVLGRKRP